jgi:acyl-CoA thioester hydrolase
LRRLRLSDAVEIWRGGVNTWECDEMGHMNVRFYVTRFMEGLGGLALRLGLPDAFKTRATATLLPLEHHLRFLKEAHAGTPLHMTGGVIAMGDTGAELLQVLLHTRTGEPCATALTRIAHVAPDGRPFPWPDRTRAAARALEVEIPPYAAPRSVHAGRVESIAALETADRLGLGCAGRGVVSASECDAQGRVRPELFIARVSDGVPGLLTPVRKAIAEALGEDQPKRMGGAVLEYRLIYLDWPAAGDHFELRSGLQAVEDKTQRLNHWLLDPVSGKAWGTAEAVAVNFDLDSRKVVPIAPAARAAIQPFVVEGLGF